VSAYPASNVAEMLVIDALEREWMRREHVLLTVNGTVA
jgi:hypothetical protein